MIIVVLYDASYQNLASFSLEFLSKYVFTFFRNISYIVLLTKSERAAERLLESSTKNLEETLKLRVNREKSRTVSVFARTTSKA